jgi:2-polyprenyl-6-methoxyphenol hydroxylase-like FAD-dependent oxidoreductase
MIRSTIPPSPFDVVVVGARCAGAATAMLLARSGRRVLVVDRGRYATDTVSTHALMRAAVVSLHRWKLLPAIIAAGTPPVRQATFFYGRDLVPVPIKPRDGIDALYAPRRYLLDRLLVDAAADAGAEIIYGVRLVALERSAGGAVTGVVLEDGGGQIHRVATRLVIGADGMRSTVARLADAQTERVGRHASGTMYGHWTGVETDGYEWYFADGISAAAIPTNADGVCVSVSVRASEFPRLFSREPERAFRQLLATAAPDLADRLRQADGTRLRGFGGHPGFLRRAHGRGWALAGDAGYFKDPVTAHGITDALRDAELLARAVADASDDALAEYQAQRDAASVELFEITDAIASFDWTLTGLRELHEALARSMSREVRWLAGV